MKVAFFALAATSFLGLAERPSSLIKKTPKKRFNDVSSNLNLKIENFSSANPSAKNRIAVATTIDEFDFVNFKEESSTGLFDYGDLNSFTKNSAHNLKISDFNLYQDPNLLLAQDGDVRNLITRAAEEGKTEIIKHILEKKPDLLKEQDKGGWNAMTKAVRRGKIEIIELFLDKNPDLLKVQDKGGWNAMTIAALLGKTEIIKLILEKNPDLLKVQDKGARNAMTIAAHFGKTEIIELFLDKNPDLLKVQDKGGQNAMKRAVVQDKIEIIKHILEKNPDLLKVQDKNGYNAMTMAVEQGKIEIIKLILEKNPDLLKEQDKDGWNAMTKAVEQGKIEIVELFLDKNPDLLLAQDGDGRNLITRAVEEGKIEIIKLILEKNPDLLKEQDKYGWNAMTMAAHFEQTEIIKLILEQYKGLSKWDTVKLLRYPDFSYNLYQLNPKKYIKLFHKLIILKLLSLVLMKMIYKILHDMSEKNKIRTIYKKINQQDISEFKDSVGNINTHQVKNLVFQFLDLKKDNQISDEEWKAITQFYKVCANGDYASFFGECPLSFADWIEIDNPVLSLGKHYEEEMLQRCQRGNGVHPLTNKKQPIIYYIDEAFQTLKREINDSIV
tara:strand:+ start:246 stop:2078 length:1833 start_codon:yes stop_codon:yes gene_type:complete